MTYTGLQVVIEAYYRRASICKGFQQAMQAYCGLFTTYTDPQHALMPTVDFLRPVMDFNW